MTGIEEHGSTTMANVSVVVVNYNSDDDLRGCLASLSSEGAAVPLDVCVVDNASSTGDVKMVAAGFPGTSLLINESNRGFAAACNQALALVGAPYILLLNPDTVVRPAAIQRMGRFLDQHPEAGGVGCRLLNEDGTLQPSITSFPQPLREAISVGLRGILRNDARARSALSRLARPLGLAVSRFDTHDEAKSVDFVRGACLMVRRRAVEEVGPLDPAYFFTGEEMDWCYRMRKAGWRIYYYPEAEVIHFDHGSTRNIMGRVFVQTRKSTLVFYEKHYPKHATFMMKVLTSLALAAKALFLTGRLATGWSERDADLALREASWFVARMNFSRRLRSGNLLLDHQFRYLR
ncbi:MAG: glycosyltransferase family 2 protein [Anaerolineae bacterium]|nr:glycosyltransferase family 2 protein [Anaerolineae bacterium]